VTWSAALVTACGGSGSGSGSGSFSLHFSHFSLVTLLAQPTIYLLSVEFRSVFAGNGGKSKIHRNSIKIFLFGQTGLLGPQHYIISFFRSFLSAPL